MQLHTLTQPSIFKGVVTTYGLPSSAGALGKLATVAVWSPAAYFKTQRLLAENIMIASVASEINLWGWLAKNFITHIHSFQSLIPFQLLGNYFEENCLLADKKTSENIDYELTFTEVKAWKCVLSQWEPSQDLDGTLLELQYQIAKLAERYWVWTPLVAMPRKFWNKWKLIVIAVVRCGVRWEMRVNSLGAADIGSSTVQQSGQSECENRFQGL